MSDQKDSLLNDLLAVSTAPAVPQGQGPVRETRSLEVRGDDATATIKGAPADAEALEGRARDLLEEYGLDPEQYEVSGFKTSRWTQMNGEEGVSAKFTFAKRARVVADDEPRDISDLLDLVQAHDAAEVVVRPTGDHCFIVALGDMQFGKCDGDGAEGTLRRVIEHLNKAADLLAFYRQRFPIGHIHVAWLGDHIEGFVSQGGANTWRTKLTLTEQTRLVRRVMYHAMETFAPLAQRVTMVAIPGNHGEAQRFNGKGVTRYDDSHDTEALIAVSEAARLAPQRFGHVEFYTPEPDEMVVVLNLAGTVTGHAHGHQIRPGKHFEWWQAQAFNGSPLGQATLLLLGHLHHFHSEEQGKRLMIQTPAEEETSKWWEHSTGIVGNPGIVVAITKDGHTGPVEVVR